LQQCVLLVLSLLPCFRDMLNASSSPSQCIVFGPNDTYKPGNLHVPSAPALLLFLSICLCSGYSV
jgi:hypothetical protein